MREQTDRTNFEIHINCVLNDVRYLPTNDISQRLGDVQTIDKACTQMVEVRSHIHHDIDAYIRRKMYKCCCVLSTLFFLSVFGLSLWHAKSMQESSTFYLFAFKFLRSKHRDDPLHKNRD